MSAKAKRAAAFYASGEAKSKKEAALMAGYTPATAHSRSHQYVDDDYVGYLLDRKGLTKDKLIEKLNAKLDATTTNVFGVQDDHGTQLKAVEMGLKLHGLLNENVTKVLNHYFNAVQVNVIEFVPAEKQVEFMKRLNEQLGELKG